MSAVATTLEPFDEAVYDAARMICTEGAILGGSHAFDDSATFATVRRIRLKLDRERPETGGVTAPAVLAALRRLSTRGLVEAVRLERRYKTRPPLPRGFGSFRRGREAMTLVDTTAVTRSVDPSDLKVLLTAGRALSFHVRSTRCEATVADQTFATILDEVLATYTCVDCKGRGRRREGDDVPECPICQGTGIRP